MRIEQFVFDLFNELKKECCHPQCMSKPFKYNSHLSESYEEIVFVDLTFICSLVRLFLRAKVRQDSGES